MSAPDQRGAPRCEVEHGCVTCADEGIPMRVVAFGTDSGLAMCEDATGARTEVMTSLVAPVGEGDRLLVHAGTALVRLPGDARREGGVS